MKKEELMKKLEELKKSGKQPHGLLKELLLDLMIEEQEKKQKEPKGSFFYRVRPPAVEKLYHTGEQIVKRENCTKF